MEISTAIKSNEELYGDVKLIPLNLDAVNQRIEICDRNIERMLSSGQYETNELNASIKAGSFWRDMKEYHCDVEL